eukprot:COSAG06_NODE_1840_length_8239_cov_3.113145_6_plen_127_part_00
MCCAARPEWPLASRDGRLAKADGPGNSVGTVALEPLRRGTAAITFRRADRHLGEIGLREVSLSGQQDAPLSRASALSPRMRALSDTLRKFPCLSPHHVITVHYSITVISYCHCRPRLVGGRAGGSA